MCREEIKTTHKGTPIMSALASFPTVSEITREIIQDAKPNTAVEYWKAAALEYLKRYDALRDDYRDRLRSARKIHDLRIGAENYTARIAGDDVLVSPCLKPNTHYTVSGSWQDGCLTDGTYAGYSCTCPDFQYRKVSGAEPCKHMTALADHHDNLLPDLGERPEQPETVDHHGYSWMAESRDDDTRHGL